MGGQQRLAFSSNYIRQSLAKVCLSYHGWIIENYSLNHSSTRELRGERVENSHECKVPTLQIALILLSGAVIPLYRKESSSKIENLPPKN